MFSILMVAITNPLHPHEVTHTFCLVKNNLKPVKTFQNLKFHQSKHHRSEEMTETKSYLKDLLRRLCSTSAITTNSSAQTKDDCGSSFQHSNKTESQHLRLVDTCHVLCFPLPSFSEDLVDDLSAGDEMSLDTQLAPACFPLPSFSEDLVDDLSAGDDMSLDAQPAPIFQLTYDSFSPMEARPVEDEATPLANCSKIDDIESLISMWIS